MGEPTAVEDDERRNGSGALHTGARFQKNHTGFCIEHRLLEAESPIRRSLA